MRRKERQRKKRKGREETREICCLYPEQRAGTDSNAGLANEKGDNRVD